MKVAGVFAAIAAGLVSVFLVVAFARALPAAVEKEKTGRENAVHAVCDSVLMPERTVPALGGDLPIAAPDFTLSDWNGKSVKLSSLRGRVVLVNFWATWCPTCVVEMPSLETLQGSQKGKPFSLLAISVDEKLEEVARFFTQGMWARGTKMTVLLDAERSVPKRYGTEKFPETFIVDKEGRVRFYVISERNWASPEIAICLDALEKE